MVWVLFYLDLQLIKYKSLSSILWTFSFFIYYLLVVAFIEIVHNISYSWMHAVYFINNSYVLLHALFCVKNILFADRNSSIIKMSVK